MTSNERKQLEEMAAEEETAPAMTLEDAERIVRRKYLIAHPVFENGAWSISDGTHTRRGRIMIPGVGWHDTIESAWMAAARIIQGEEQACK